MAGQVKHNTMLFRDLMMQAGFTVGGDPTHPICPIMIGDARLAADMADEMLKEGVYVIGFSYPVSRLETRDWSYASTTLTTGIYLFRWCLRARPGFAPKSQPPTARKMCVFASMFSHVWPRARAFFESNSNFLV